MCELFALSSDSPVDVTFSLGVFGERGGRLGPHRDGWGIAFKEGRDFRLIKEATPAAASACLRFVESNAFRSEIVMSHLRLASVPRVTTYTNTHPFARELFGVSDALRVELAPAHEAGQHVALIATQPLTHDEAWTELPLGEVVVFHRGRRVTAPIHEQAGST